jgi:hypothetical protein
MAPAIIAYAARDASSGTEVYVSAPAVCCQGLPVMTLAGAQGAVDEGCEYGVGYRTVIGRPAGTVSSGAVGALVHPPVGQFRQH